MRRARAGALGLVALLLGLAWWTRGSDAAPASGPRPAETRAGRARLARSAPVPAPAPVVAEPTPPEPAVLTVRAGSWKRWSYDPAGGMIGELEAFSVITFPPTIGWPAPDEAPFPDAPITGLIAARVAGEDVDVDALLAAAAEAGTTVDAEGIGDRPWDALIALEVERARVERDKHVATTRWQARKDAGEDPGPRPEADTEALADLAEALLARYPDAAIADHARLYQVYAYGEAGSSTYDVQDLTDAAMAGVRESPDPVVVDRMAHALSNAGAAVQLTGDDLDLLRSILDDPEAKRLPRRQVADVGMRSALAAGDVPRAAWWSARHREELAAACADEVWLSRICPELWQAQAAAEGWVAARTDATPLTWQAALTAQAQRCGQGAAVPRPALTGEGTWAAGWRWASWSEPGAVAACLAEPFDGPAPPEGQRLTLHVIGAR